MREQSNLERWARRVRGGQAPEQAAAEVGAEEPRPLTRERAKAGAAAVATVLRVAGLSPDHAAERARNIAQALMDGVEPAGRTIRQMIRPAVIDDRYVRSAARAWCETTRPDEVHIVTEPDSVQGYVAYDDATYEPGAPLGRGSTMAAAVEDLLEQLGGDEDRELRPAESCAECRS